MLKHLAIFGVPRSGTSWLGQLFNSHPQVAYRYQPLFSYAFKERVTPQSSAHEIEEFHRDLLDTKDEFVLQVKNISGVSQASFKKEIPKVLVWKEVRYLNLIEHLLVNSSVRFILIHRNPLHVIDSWVKAPKEFDSAWDIHQEWRFAEAKNQGKESEFYGFEKWKEAMRLFLKVKGEYSNRVQLVSYEALLDNTVEVMNQLFSFADLEMNEQTLEFIHESTLTDSQDPYGVHRNTQIQKAKLPDLPDDIISQINREAIELISQLNGN